MKLPNVKALVVTDLASRGIDTLAVVRVVWDLNEVVYNGGERADFSIVGDGDTTLMPLWTWRIGDSFFIGAYVAMRSIRTRRIMSTQ